jgi:hypothetical protein
VGTVDRYALVLVQWLLDESKSSALGVIYKTDFAPCRRVTKRSCVNQCFS